MIAIGQVSLGVISIGQVARGIFCVGQGAVGVVCAGQGALGLWHASGLLGIAGQRGYGIILHTLPRLVREAPPELAAPTPIDKHLATLLVGGHREDLWNGADIIPKSRAHRERVLTGLAGNRLGG